MIRTVTGDIEASDMGFTYSHQHLLGAPPEGKRTDDDLVILDEAKAEEEACAAIDVGVKTLFEASAWDYSRQPAALRRISERTGLQIIACGGFNKGRWFDDLLADESVESLQERIVRDVTVGIDGTDVRAGVIKYGTSYNKITPVELRVLTAAARAHRRTGAVLHGHTEIGTMALEQLDLLAAEGVRLDRVGIVHLMRNPDPYLHIALASRGAYLCYDGFSKIKYFPDSVRNDVILRVIDAGYLDKILIGDDLARRSDLTAYSNGPGQHYVAGVWLPRFRDQMVRIGFSLRKIDHIVDRLFVENPKSYFDFCEPY